MQPPGIAEPPPTLGAPAATPALSEASRARQPDVATPASRTAAPWPWYRREPWLAVTLSSFVPIGVGFLTPPAFHILLLGLSAVLMLLSAAMLIRQGPFREHPRPDRAPDVERGATWGRADVT